MIALRSSKVYHVDSPPAQQGNPSFHSQGRHWNRTPRIVIVGAGPAGINAAQTLAHKLKPSDNTEVVVIEKNAFYYHTVGAPRAYTEAEYTPKMFIPYDKAIPTSAAAFVKIIRAVATSVTASEVSFQRIGADDKPATETETITFDYLVLATGSTYTVPIKQAVDDYSRATTEKQLQEVRDQIIKADKILIVGGGAVGCEVAGDIAAHFPNKHVTILEGRDKLIATSNLRDKFRDYLTQALDKLKIHVITGERLTERLTGNSFEKRTLRTDKGTEIESDIQLLCGGFHPVADLVQAMDAAMVDERGAVKVNDLMQLDDPKYAHIFALGDMTNHRTPKLSYMAGEQAKHLAAELAAVIRKKQSAVTKPFPVPTVETLVMPLGPHGGVSQLPVWGGSVVGDFMTRMIKSSDMFAGRIWGSLGATMPQ